MRWRTLDSRQLLAHVDGLAANRKAATLQAIPRGQSTTDTFTYEASDDDADGYLLDGDLLDLEPALRDALVLELPLAPLCADDCPGLCSECGIRLAEAGDGHAHADAGTDLTPDGTPVPDTRKER